MLGTKSKAALLPGYHVYNKAALLPIYISYLYYMYINIYLYCLCISYKWTEENLGISEDWDFAYFDSSKNFQVCIRNTCLKLTEHVIAQKQSHYNI